MTEITTIDEITRTRFAPFRNEVEIDGVWWNVMTKRIFLEAGLAMMFTDEPDLEWGMWVPVEVDPGDWRSIPHSTTHEIVVVLARRMWGASSDKVIEIPSMEDAIKELRTTKDGWPPVQHGEYLGL